MSYQAEFQARIRALHQAAHPDAWPHLNPAIVFADPAIILNAVAAAQRCAPPQGTVAA